MTFDDWSNLSRHDPAAAARTVHARISSLPKDQQRAIFAWISPEPVLTATLARQSVSNTPLAGVPYVLKDLFAVRGVPTRAGSSFLAEVRPVPTQDGALVRALEGAGAALAATTHLYEFAYGLTSENIHYGDVLHPRFPNRTTGGSSSGSVAAVAAGVVPLGIGTDTGGSIRVPAAFCGVYGLRLTPHHAWIADAFPLASRFDTAGWFTRTAKDMRTAVGALIGLRGSARPLRGIYLDFEGWVDADDDLKTAVRTAAARWAPPADAASRAELLHGFKDATETYAILQSSEALEIHREWIDAFPDRYSPIVRERIIRGRNWTEDQLLGARTKNAAIHLLWTKFFLTFDFLVLPATPFPAVPIKTSTQDDRNRMLALTTPASLGGLPVLTVPVKLPSGLTTGLQIVVNNAQSPVVNWVLSQMKDESRES